MTINKQRVANFVAAALLAALVSACGLKGDLYIPAEEAEAKVVPVEVQNTEDPNADDEAKEESEQAP